MILYIFMACGANITNTPPNTYDEQNDIKSDITENNTEENTNDVSNTENENVEETNTEEDSSNSSDTNSEESENSSTELPSDLMDYSLPGSYTYTSTNSTATVTNCMSGLSYTVYTPDSTEDLPVVILGHGFLRGGEKMFGWAEHLASWGIKTVVPTLCHYNILNGVDHEMNGQNMVELAEIVGAETPIYAGQSAGGLAAIIAASIDAAALGVVGLDATDTAGIPGIPDNIGLNYISNITTPAFALVGEPSTCNSNNNGVTMYDGIANSHIVRVTDSDHCDYESPTDWGCESFCLNEGTTLSDDDIRPLIKQLGTAAIILIAGNQAEAQDVWNTDNLSILESNGVISILK